MKYLHILLITLLLCSCTAQKPPVFTYNWQIQDGIFTVKFANNPWSDSGTSTEVYGYFTTECRQTYLDFISKLLYYGNTPAHWQGITDSTDNLILINEQSHPFILMVDNFGRVWKITKSDALILAGKLNQTILINQLVICPDIVCICNPN